MLISTSRYWDKNNNISRKFLKKKLISNTVLPYKIVFTDASSFASSSYAVKIFTKVVHKLQTTDENQKSLSYRECFDNIIFFI